MKTKFKITKVRIYIIFWVISSFTSSYLIGQLSKQTYPNFNEVPVMILLFYLIGFGVGLLISYLITLTIDLFVKG